MPTRGKPKTNSSAKQAGKRAAPATAKLSLQVQYASECEALPTRAQLRRWVRAALARSAQIALRIVDAAEAQALNEKFRRKDYATNVLSFVYHAPMLKAHGTGKQHVPATERPPLCGDIVLCAPVIEREAREQGKPLLAHYAHLTVHGVLHLQGYDHLRVRDAKVMERIETDTLATLGFPDPYRAAAERSPLPN